eukprot:15442475-Alexandrium_andersonii.AAC.1
MFGLGLEPSLAVAELGCPTGVAEFICQHHYRSGHGGWCGRFQDPERFVFVAPVVPDASERSAVYGCGRGERWLCWQPSSLPGRCSEQQWP